MALVLKAGHSTSLPEDSAPALTANRHAINNGGSPLTNLTPSMSVGNCVSLSGEDNNICIVKLTAGLPCR